MATPSLLCNITLLSSDCRTLKSWQVVLDFSSNSWASFRMSLYNLWHFSFVILYLILTWKDAENKTTSVLKWIIRKSIETQQKLKWLEIVSINWSMIEILLFSQEQFKHLYWGEGQGKLTLKPQKASKKTTVVLSLSDYQNAHSINAP